MLTSVASRPFTNSEKNRNLKVVRKGNRIMASHAMRLYGNRKRKNFRERLFNGTLDWKAEGITQSEYRDMMAVKALEIRMLEAYVSLIRQIAMRWWQTTHVTTGADWDDYGQVACLAFLDSLYSYGVGKKSKSGRRNVAFSSYVHNSIKNKMTDYVARNRLLGGFTLEDFLRFGSIEKYAANHPGLTYDELTCRFCLTPEEIKSFESWQKCAVCESQLNELGTGENDASDPNETSFHEPDYSAVSPKSCFSNPCVAREPQGDSRMYDAIENVKKELTPFEMDVLISSTDDRGWQTDVAARHINPKTGKSYSRMAPGVCLPKIHERITEEYETICKGNGDC